MLAARLLTGNKGGQISNARTEILPHQIFTAHRVVSSPRRRFLLADEVGLGKTIEAGMIWQALHQRGQARRTLITKGQKGSEVDLIDSRRLLTADPF